MSLGIRESINKIKSFQPNQSKIWYHGSDKTVSKFLFSLIGKNSNRISNYHGYGIYFIGDLERAKKYGDVITRVIIDDNADILKGKITRNQLSKIYFQLVKEKVTLKQDDQFWYNNPTYSEYSVLTDAEEFYEFLLRTYDSFKNIQDVTEFLIRSGIDGMEVINDVGDEILVVFDENVIEVV